MFGLWVYVLNTHLKLSCLAGYGSTVMFAVFLCLWLFFTCSSSEHLICTPFGWDYGFLLPKFLINQLKGLSSSFLYNTTILYMRLFCGVMLRQRVIADRRLRCLVSGRCSTFFAPTGINNRIWFVHVAGNLGRLGALESSLCTLPCRLYQVWRGGRDRFPCCF